MKVNFDNRPMTERKNALAQGISLKVAGAYSFLDMRNGTIPNGQASKIRQTANALKALQTQIYNAEPGQMRWMGEAATKEIGNMDALLKAAGEQNQAQAPSNYFTRQKRY